METQIINIVTDAFGFDCHAAAKYDIETQYHTLSKLNPDAIL